MGYIMPHEIRKRFLFNGIHSSSVMIVPIRYKFSLQDVQIKHVFFFTNNDFEIIRCSVC